MPDIIDLTLSFQHGKRGVSLQPVSHIAEKGYNTTNLLIYSHALTHMDAPRHFLADGYDIETIPLERCIGDALLIDVTHKVPNSFIVPEDLGDAADKITEGSRVLLRSDWSLRADGDDYRTHFPRISLELAQWFADRKIWLLGLETPSVASLHEHNRQELIDVHQVLLHAEIVIVESLANLRAITQPDFEFIALPLRITGSDGSPVRAIAIEK